MPALTSKGAGKTAGPVHMTSSHELVQSKSSAQRLSEGEKLLTVKIQSPRKGKAEANRRAEAIELAGKMAKMHFCYG